MTRQSNEPPTRILHDTPDWDLVTATQAGDVDAFGELYQRHSPAILRYLRFRVPDHGIVEDLAADTWVKAFRSIGNVTDQGKEFVAWLYTIAGNRLLDHWKSSRVKCETPSMFGDITDLVAEILIVDTDVERIVVERCAARDNARVLHDHIQLLVPAQRECVTHRFFSELSVRETADVLGIKEGAVKALQHRAVHRLAQLIPEGTLCN